jgi:Uma2 family endonuclease
MSAPRRRATYDDLVRVPEHMVAEIIDGELVVSPRPASPHARAASVLGADLNGAFDRPPGDPKGPGGWWILFEPELHLDGDVVVPDVVGWRRDRMPVMPNTPAFQDAPDWICEVVSISTATVDRGRKMRIYARAGVHHLWIVDPILRTLEVYELAADRWVVAGAYGGTEPVRAAPFDVIELDVARWWLAA